MAESTSPSQDHHIADSWPHNTTSRTRTGADHPAGPLEHRKARLTEGAGVRRAPSGYSDQRSAGITGFGGEQT
ncbi:hypothetical protein SAMN04487819_108214 [Actinopolyspora alba]|uniref:Uncharacterized protein n=1 Tax=Actinopolyspora alba TaxID=673379 RepID=A0A1I1Y6J9_9ACTN|nr:hypothetical protein SAMN04487819_108214 [Actinopolyspora alba]